MSSKSATAAAGAATAGSNQHHHTHKPVSPWDALITEFLEWCNRHKITLIVDLLPHELGHLIAEYYISPANAWNTTLKYIERDEWTPTFEPDPSSVAGVAATHQRVCRIMSGGGSGWTRLWGERTFRESFRTVRGDRSFASFAVSFIPALPEPKSRWDLTSVMHQCVIGVARDPQKQALKPAGDTFGITGDAYALVCNHGNSTLQKTSRDVSSVNWIANPWKMTGWLKHTIGVVCDITTGTIWYFHGTAASDVRSTQPIPHPLVLIAATPEAHFMDDFDRAGMAFYAIDSLGDYVPFVCLTSHEIHVKLIPEWTPPESFFASIPGL